MKVEKFLVQLEFGEDTEWGVNGEACFIDRLQNYATRDAEYHTRGRVPRVSVIKEAQAWKRNSAVGLPGF